jgi:predicted MFS family arabinose efflux permease
MTPRTTWLFAASVAVIVLNLFAPQTLVGLIGPSLGLKPVQGGLISMATLLGYAAGLFLLVPLADLLENRRLVVAQLIVAIAAAAAAMFVTRAEALLLLLFVLGAACSAIQVLVPIAAHMASPQRRGQVIGDVMGGLMVGILLSRPLASLVADAWGWRAFYGISAAAMALLTWVLATRLPVRQPAMQASYPALIGSLWRLLCEEPVLRRRALSASLVMGAFSLFWTAVALRLAQAPFGLGQRGIALFALAGAGGAIVTPLAGRLGDRGWTRAATLAAHALLLGAFALAAWAGGQGLASRNPLWPLLAMGAAAVLLDVGVTGDQTLGRRAINMLRPEARGRINGVFVGVFFLGGAAGSALAGAAWAAGGWNAVCAAGGLFALAATGTGLWGRDATISPARTDATISPARTDATISPARTLPAGRAGRRA